MLNKILNKEFSVLSILISVLILGTITGFGIHLIFAWTGPTTNPPDSNISALLNTGSAEQTKSGTLNIGGQMKATGGFCIGTDCITEWPSGSTGDIPSGMIAMFDTSCPTGWTRFAALDGKFAMGASSYGATGGTSTHIHSVNPPATDTATPGCDWHGADDPNPNQFCGNIHTHSVDISAFDSGSGSSLPPYVSVVFCKKD